MPDKTAAEALGKKKKKPEDMTAEERAEYERTRPKTLSERIGAAMNAQIMKTTGADKVVAGLKNEPTEDEKKKKK